MSLTLLSLADNNRVSLTGKRSYLVGRHEGADLVISGPTAEPRLALIASYPTGWFLHSLKGQSPILQNGKAILRCRLTPGDRLQFCGQDYFVEALMRSQDVSPNRPLPATGDRVRCRLFLQAGEFFRRQHETLDDTLIGDAPECDLQLPELYGLAPRHALLAWMAGRWYLHNISGKARRVLYNGKPTTSMVLTPGDRVKLAKMWLIFGDQAASLPRSREVDVG